MGFKAENFETLLESSLSAGRDSKGQFYGANFKENDVFVSVEKRGESYRAEWSTRLSLQDIRNELQGFAHPNTVTIYDLDDRTSISDADAWNPKYSQDIKKACFNYPNFAFEWIPFYSQSSNAEKFSDLAFCGTTETLNDAAQNFPRIYNSISDAKKEDINDVFDDVLRYLK